MADDEVLEFDFEGIEPAAFGSFVAMPKGEYTLQCMTAEKFCAKDKQSGQPDPNRPGLKFTFSVTNHPAFTGTEISIWHMFEEKSRKYLLNTLMCLIPEFDWQKNGIKIPLSSLFQKVQGRPVNGTIDWEINSGSGANAGKKYVNSRLQGLKKYDSAITQPVATKDNPPIIDNSQSSVSPTTASAAAGIPAEEVNAFLDSFASSPAPAASADGFGLDPF